VALPPQRFDQTFANESSSPSYDDARHVSFLGTLPGIGKRALAFVARSHKPQYCGVWQSLPAAGSAYFGLKTAASTAKFPFSPRSDSEGGMKAISRGFLGLCGLGLLSIGCARPAPPFDTIKTSNLLAFRLQNYEPPAQVQPIQTPGGGISIPGIPPEITQWAQAALPGLQQLIPPGLLPPGLIPGAPQAGAPAAAPNAPRFPMQQPNFRILGQNQIMDEDLKKELGKVLGKEKNFTADHANCMYAEMGLSWGQAPYDLLISFSCNQVEARNFAWPHPYRGMKKNTVEALAKVVQQVFPTAG
jgi:hypothetical protein